MGSKILVLSEGREEDGVQILAEDHLQTHAGEWEREKRKKETQTNIMGEGERQRCRDKARRIVLRPVWAWGGGCF